MDSFSIHYSVGNLYFSSSYERVCRCFLFRVSYIHPHIHTRKNKSFFLIFIRVDDGGGGGGGRGWKVGRGKAAKKKRNKNEKSFFRLLFHFLFYEVLLYAYLISTIHSPYVGCFLYYFFSFSHMPYECVNNCGNHSKNFFPSHFCLSFFCFFYFFVTFCGFDSLPFLYWVIWF